MIEVITMRNIRIASYVLHLLTDEAVLDFKTSINWRIKLNGKLNQKVPQVFVILCLDMSRLHKQHKVQYF